jgi:hypothetical protein
MTGMKSKAIDLDAGKGFNITLVRRKWGNFDFILSFLYVCCVLFKMLGEKFLKVTKCFEELSFIVSQSLNTQGRE